MPKGYNASETSVHFMGYHFVWCPKYRRKVLVGKVEQRLKELIKESIHEEIEAFLKGLNQKTIPERLSLHEAA